jgi:AcrR family transcriptional regulator
VRRDPSRGPQVVDTHASEESIRPQGVDEVRISLVAAARGLLESTPPAQVSLRAIADEAQVNYGLIHRHFGSKAELLVAVMMQIRDDYVGQLDPDASVLDQLFGPIEWIVSNPVVGRILIWLTSESVDPGIFGTSRPLIRRSEQLLAEAGVEDPTAVIAHQVSAAYGWIAFETSLMNALGQDEIQEARDRFLAYARGVLAREIDEQA